MHIWICEYWVRFHHKLPCAEGFEPYKAWLIPQANPTFLQSFFHGVVVLHVFRNDEEMPLNFLALSSFGFSIAQCCFSNR